MSRKRSHVAVITADIIGSRQYSGRERGLIDKELRRAIDVATRQYRKFIHTPASFRVTVGDEFQWIVGVPSKAFEILVFLRSLAAGIKVRPMVAFRASIGVGEIAVNTGRSPYEKDGPPFLRSRTGLDFLVDHKRRWTTLTTGDVFCNRIAETMLTLLDSFQKRWTQAQWEAIRWTMMGHARKDIARRLRVAPQNVSKRLIAAEWDTFAAGAALIQELTDTTHPKMGASDDRTPKRVRRPIAS
jgi:hypothetical protein